MHRTFRVLFSVLSAICVALVLPLGSIFGFAVAGGCILFAILFAGLMHLCKQNQEIEERKEQEKSETASLESSDKPNETEKNEPDK